MSKSPINIVWFKRDLRFTDHEPLFRALEEDIPVLLIYFFEPSLINFYPRICFNIKQLIVLLSNFRLSLRAE